MTLTENNNTIREHLEEREILTLSEYATKSRFSKGRKIQEEECVLRTKFQRDRDRIIHSKAFRRLKHKTQVFLSPFDDHFRTRLTHTLEVAQIGRTIARALNLNEDLTEAIALGHDLGHTPFGHCGEGVLNELVKGGFHHNIQSVRVVEILERLNLCAETIDGIMTHTWGFEPKTPEAQIVQLADKTAYINHDIEDAITAGIITENDLPKDCTDFLGHSKSERITSLITSLVENSGSEIKMDRETFGYFDKLHKYMYRNVYTDSAAKIEEKKVDKLIEELYRYYYKNPEKMPEMYRIIAENEDLDRAVTDYIQGMSDDFASTTFDNIFIPKAWKIK